VYICLCKVVTRATIEAVIAGGARTVEEVGQRCAAGTDCGKCQRNIGRLLTQVKHSEAGKESTQRGA
jgi:bacterioferritin-associated ferredoxin